MSEFVPYMQRTRDYYRAQGFARDYVWAQNEATPFHRLAKPLSDCKLTLVTTAVPDPSLPMSARLPASLPFAEAPKAFDTQDLSWDKDNTHTDDRQSYFPLEVLTRLAGEGVIGALAEKFHFVPTQYSQRLTLDEDAPQIADACVADQIDLALLVPL